MLVILVLLVAAANLVTHARARHAARTPVALSPALRPPPDGLARAKVAVSHAVETEALRAAVLAFHQCEGRAPLSLSELAATGYLRDAPATARLERFHYDPSTLSVTCMAR